MRLSLLGLASCLLVFGGASAIALQQPYAGMEQRAIKALSENEIADLLAGRGAGYALAAELNGYPGPTHVLELADELELTSEQRSQMEALFADMQQNAIARGEAYIAAEAELEKAFASGSATPATVASLTVAAAEAEALLRQAHLETHLKTLPLLTPHQVALYNNLRGYAGGGGQHQHGHKHH